MNRPVLTDRIALLLLGVGIILVFLPLFFPTLSIIATPDFGRSDAWHFSFPTKFALAQALKQGTLPLWEPNLSGGFPLFAEGQTGALFFPNMLLFRLLPVVLAYNLALTGAIAGLAFGTYAYVRIIKRSPEAAFFAALVFAFSGLPVLQLPHITLLQGMSLLPAIASLGLLFFLRFSWLYVPVFAVLLSQQIFAGFPQATFITLFFVFVQSVFFADACPFASTGDRYTPWHWVGDCNRGHPTASII